MSKNTNTICATARGELEERVWDVRPPAELDYAEEFQLHVQSCVPCRAYLARLRSLPDALAASRRLQPPPALGARLLEAARAGQPSRLHAVRRSGFVRAFAQRAAAFLVGFSGVWAIASRSTPAELAVPGAHDGPLEGLVEALKAAGSDSPESRLVAAIPEVRLMQVLGGYNEELRR
jgi:hypothetical protein